jgi:hypothetical protein
VTKKVQAPPKGTGTNGAKLWRDVLGSYELVEHEMALLREAVRTVDQLDELHAIASAEGLVVSGPHGSKAHSGADRGAAAADRAGADRGRAASARR